MKEMTELQEQWIKKIEKCPKETQDYIKELLRELWLCYEWMSDKEKFAIVKNEFNSKSSSYYMFYDLLCMNDMKKIIGKK